MRKGVKGVKDVELIADKLEEKSGELENQETLIAKIKQGGKRTRKNCKKNSRRNHM
jgi:hypothetical protein